MFLFDDILLLTKVKKPPRKVRKRNVRQCSQNTFLRKKTFRETVNGMWHSFAAIGRGTVEITCRKRAAAKHNEWSLVCMGGHKN